MQTSKKKINRKLEKQVYNLLYQIVVDIHDLKEAEQFLKDFLTETELEVLCKRLAVAYYLDRQRSYENIKDNLAVSSATIASISEQISKKGFKLALNKIQADEWADKWAQKIGQVMKFGRK